MSVAPFYNKTVTGINSSGGTVDLSAPGPIGAGTPSTGAFTTLTSSGVVNTGGMNGTIGATTPNTGVFTTTTATTSTANNVILNLTKTTVTANNTIITLTATSNGNQLLVETGAGNYTGCFINLPSTATLTAGQQYLINNNCATTSWTVQTSTAAAVVTSAPGAYFMVTVLSVASDLAASWDFHAAAPQGTTWSTAALATNAIINGAGGFNGTVGAQTPNTGSFTTLNTSNSTNSSTVSAVTITNTNVAPRSTLQISTPNSNTAQQTSLDMGQTFAGTTSLTIGYLHHATIAANRRYYFGSFDQSVLFTMYGSASTASTLSTPLTVSGLITGTDYSGTVGATAASTGKHTTLQLTTSMATAGVLLNDASGNITSSLGALAVAKGGTGVAASYGTGTTVALPPTGGVAGQALVSGAGAGAALTWSTGQGGSINRYQGTLQSLPNSTLTIVLFQTAGNTVGQGALITYSAGTFTYTGQGTAAILVTASVALASATTLTLTISNNDAIAIVPSNAINTSVLTGSISAVILLAQNETFSIRANQGSGGALNTVVGPGANGCNMSATILPI